MDKVSVIVVTFKGMKWYDRCFTSLIHSDTPLNIIVIDNASDDGSTDYIKMHYPEIHIIASKENLGFGRANNLGIRYALDHGAQYVFLLNQDAWIEPDTIAELISISQTHPEYGILSPIHLNVTENKIEKLLLQRLDDSRTTDPDLFDDLFFHRLKDVYETKYVNAAAWFVPRKTFEMIGGFDPIFFHYGEDDNFINRVMYHGLKIGICPKLTIVHDNDRPRPLYDSREREVLMLIDYTNVNRRHDIAYDMRQHRLKSIKSLIKGRRKVAQQHYEDYCWLKKHRRGLETSVITNRELGPHWF